MTAASTASTRDEFAGRVFSSVLGALDTWAIFVGDKLGLYEALASNGSLKVGELAAHCGVSERYAHEWLEHQVTGEILEVDDPKKSAHERLYSLPSSHAEVLTDKDNLAYLTPLVRLIVAGGTKMPSLLEAYRTGGGVSWAEFGEDMRTGQAEMNRPWFIKELGNTWLPIVPDLHDKLGAGAIVADIGCGEGWSAIGIAEAYPNTTVHGYDVDVPSMDAARRHADAAGVHDRTEFLAVDAADAEKDQQYDVVTAFECIHDLPDPVGVLRSMREMVKEDGFVLVMDEAVADAFGDSHDDVERLMYGFSMFVCLPDGMSHQPSVGTGTVMRQSTLEDYADQAGFSGVEVLPIENDLWRFYRLSL